MKYQEEDKPIPDSEYTLGHIRFIVEGNKGRYLDNRRTPGEIESVNEKHAIFYWRVGAFEDKGAIWELDFNEIENFQFEAGSREIGKRKIVQYEKTNKSYCQRVIINNNKDDLVKSNTAIKREIDIIKDRGYLKALSETKIDELNSTKELIQMAINDYLQDNGLLAIDEKITRMIVSNPYSGEILKHLWFKLAKMGFVRYENRKLKVLDNLPKEKELESYIIKRIAFVRAMFGLTNIQEITTYRGMSSSCEWLCYPKAFSSWSFDFNVADDLAKIHDNNEVEIAYLMKRKTRINEVFMTSIETKQMNKLYDEKEILLFANPQNGIF